MTAQKKSKPVVLTGYVTPTSWDANQNIKGISLLTTDHDEIKIAHTEKGDRLLSLVWEKVELTGYLENERGRKKMKVIHYKPAEFDSLAGDADELDDINADYDDELRDVFGGSSISSMGESETSRGL